MSRRPQSVQDRLEVAELREQVRSYGTIEPAEVSRLLADVRGDEASPSRQRLVEHHLEIALDEAELHSDRGIEVGDLFQEGTLAVMAAVQEYAVRDGPASGLAAFTRRVVAAHLDAVVEAAELEQRSEEAFVRDAQLLEIAEVGMRRRLGREATPTELASLLEWPPERVEIMAGMLAAARSLYDRDIAQYLDDE
jgi:DNA-directed RNA polymerase sigma subunit (sigma70/sigma32)